MGTHVPSALKLNIFKDKVINIVSCYGRIRIDRYSDRNLRIIIKRGDILSASDKHISRLPIVLYWKAPKRFGIPSVKSDMSRYNFTRLDVRILCADCKSRSFASSKSQHILSHAPDLRGRSIPRSETDFHKTLWLMSLLPLKYRRCLFIMVDRDLSTRWLSC